VSGVEMIAEGRCMTRPSRASAEKPSAASSFVAARWIVVPLTRAVSWTST